jgi:solute carrier family 5 (sodium-coupled monocarboxylate transporter), member 8/12
VGRFSIKVPQFRQMKDKNQLKIIRIIATIYGLIIMAIAFSVEFMSGIIEYSRFLTAAASGPLLGIFLLAILVPIANWKGATVGALFSFLVIFTMAVGYLNLDNRNTGFLETSIHGCKNDSFSSIILSKENENYENFHNKTPWIIKNLNSSSVALETTHKTFSDYKFPENIYAISYMWYSVIGTFITVFVGTLVSFMTISKSDKTDLKFVHPWIQKIIRNKCS